MMRSTILLCAALACAKTVPAPAGLGEPCVGNGDCATGFLCAAARCVLPANLGGCEPGRLRCNGADVEKCDDTGLAWSLQQTCATGCAAGACNPQVCTPGAARCQGNASEQCTPAGDSWALVQVCPSLCAPDTGLCRAPVCTPFSTRCDPAGDPTLSQVCDSYGASWQNLPCGDGHVCDQGRCQDVVCSSGQTRCSADGGSVETCNSARDGWASTQSCTTHCAVSTGVAQCLPVVCAVGDQQCSGSALQQCLPDRSGWGFVAFCASGCVDSSSTAAACAPPVCAPFARQCAPGGGSVQICKADGTGWAPGDTCPQGCAGGNCITVSAGCNPGDLRCNGVDAQKCAQASPGVTQWNTFATCLDGCSSGACLPGGSCAGVTLHAAAPSVPGDGVSTVLVYSDPILGADGSPIPDGQTFDFAVSPGTVTGSVKSFAGGIHFEVHAPALSGADVQATVTAQLAQSSFCSASTPITFTAAASTSVFVAEDFTNPAMRNLSVANAANWDSTDGALLARWPGDVGQGEDGAFAVAAGVTENLSTDGRAPAYAVLGLSGLTVSVDAVTTLSAGDEVLLWDAQGSSSGTSNAGSYELHHVASASGSQVVLAEALSGYFGAGADQDVALQHVVLQRVPHLGSLTVAAGGTLTANAWDGTKGGLIFIRVSGAAKIQGDVSMNAAGFRGGRTAVSYYGEDPSGLPPSGGWGAGYYEAGGSYGTQGGAGSGGTAGSVYGLPLLGKLHLGSGGGAFNGSTNGGAGGGAIVIFAGSLTLVSDSGNNTVGRIHADGQQGAANAGGGSGGSVWVAAPSVTVGNAGVATPFSAAGAAASGTGGAGGAGRIRIDELTTDAASSAALGARANPAANFGVAGPLIGQSLDEYNSSSLAIRSATLVLALGGPTNAAYFAAANTADPPDFGPIPSTIPGTVMFQPGTSPAIGTRFRWKAQLSPSPGQPQTLLGLQWSLTVN